MSRHDAPIPAVVLHRRNFHGLQALFRRTPSRLSSFTAPTGAAKLRGLMAEPFKNLLNAEVVRHIGLHLQRAWPAFERERFEAQAIARLDTLELKARAQHLADALQACLPSDFEHAAQVMEASLATPDDELQAPMGARSDGLGGWAVWPLTEHVARHGHGDVPRALQALHAMTRRFSAEWAIRPFILRHPELTFDTLQRWTRDPSAHVRRLVSEGSRPRLPWGAVLKPLIADPSPTLPLLRALQDDSSDYVRRSVANHLNDIAKDHPHVVVQWLQQHLPDATAQRRGLLRHASRNLIKQGHPDVLAAWGTGAPLRGQARLRVSPARLTLGGTLELQVELDTTDAQPQSLVVDYAVHHVKANGRTSPKVFKGWNLRLGPGERRTLRKAHAVKPITTRRYHAGVHRVELLVNGQAVAEAAFELSV